MAKSSASIFPNHRWLVLAFLLAGFIAVILRIYFLSNTQNEPVQPTWKITLLTQVEAKRNDTRILVASPRGDQAYKQVSQSFFHPGMRLARGNRLTPSYIQAKATESGPLVLLTEYYVQKRPTQEVIKRKNTRLGTEQRVRFLSLTPEAEGYREHFSELLKPEKSVNQVLKEIAQNNQGLNSRKQSLPSSGLAALAVQLLRLRGVPSRVVGGIRLVESAPEEPYFWLEYYDESAGWIGWEFIQKEDQGVSDNLIAFMYDENSFFKIENGRFITEKVQVEQDFKIMGRIEDQRGKGLWDIFDLQRLDVDTKSALSFLLILPYCVLFTAFIRHVLGFYPYGTFTAPLLALALVYADILVTLSIVGIVLAIAMFGLAMLPKGIHRSSRLSIIFTFVAMSMVLGTSVMAFLSMNPGGSIILLPTIILVAIVDRFYSYMDDSGLKAAMIRLMVTFVIAFLCVPIFNIEGLSELTLSFPELHFVTIALVLMFSGYTGARLTDLQLLRLFGENRSLGSNKRKKESTEQI